MLEENREAREQGQPKRYMLYQLSNSRGRMLQITKRIEQLQARQTVKPRQQIEGVIGTMSWRISEDFEENRIKFTSTERPSREICQLLKQHGFKWSLTRGAWVRQLTANARFAADRLVTKLRSP